MIMRRDTARSNALLPAAVADLPLGQDMFYICNTLVPEADGSRIIGPLTAEGLEEKRKAYGGVIAQLDEGAASQYPFVVYRLTRIE